jgi:phosphate transport system substrate-binding protein
LVALVFALVLAWSGGGTAAELKGQLLITGSTSVQPLSEELAQEFMARHPGVNVVVRGGGSSAGIAAAHAGTADLGSSSRDLTAVEQTGLQLHEFARDGIVVVVHPSNPVTNLTTEQVRRIFAGQITAWRQIGGWNERITVVIRDARSGTRGAFEELVMGNQKVTRSAVEQESTGAVMATVAQTKGAIGYISLGSLDGMVKALSVDGVAPSEEHIRQKLYRISRPFLYLTKGAPSELARAYLDFVLSREGQTIVARDYLPVRR